MRRFSVMLAHALVIVSVVACGPTSESLPTAPLAQRSTLVATSVEVTPTAMSTRTASSPRAPVTADTTASATATATHTPSPRTLETLVSSVTPALSPRVTRTPLQSGPCPAPSDETPPIVPISPGTGIIEGFASQMRVYLDAGGSTDGLQGVLGELTLTDGDGAIWQARAQVVVVDVTGNTILDVVVGLTFLGEGGFADGGLFVFRCRDGRYEGGVVTPLSGQIHPEGGPGPGIRVIQDLNANGVLDIVFSYIEVVGTHANFTRLFRVVEWDGSEFVDLVQSDAYPLDAAPVLNGDGTVLDSNGDGSLELVLTNGIGHGYVDGGPQRARNDVWAWNGQAFTLSRSEYEPPAYRFEAVQDGDDAAQAGDYPGALASYQQAISDEGLLGWSPGQLWPDSAYGVSPTPTPDPDESPRLTAYANYRMMLVYVLQGNLAEARVAYGTLEQLPQDAAGRPYADLAVTFWEEYSASGDVAVACARAAALAEAHADEILAPLGSGFYGHQNRNYEGDEICPFE